MQKVKLRKVGGSTTVALPPHVLTALSLAVGNEVNVEVVNGRVIMEPVAHRHKPTMAELLAQCDFSKPYTKAERAEMDAWERMPAVGNEFGSPEWNAAEKAGKKAGKS